MKPHRSQSVHLRPPTGSPLNRRQFLAASATICAAALVPRHVLGAGETPPSEKLNIAGIGVEGMGANNLENLNSQNIVALCDVDPHEPRMATHDYAAVLPTEHDFGSVHETG
jgi:hypothetical protein